MQETRNALKRWIYGMFPSLKNEIVGPIFVLIYPIMGFIMYFKYWEFYYVWMSAILFFAYQIGFLLCFADGKDIFLSIATGIYALTSFMLFISNQYFSNLVNCCIYGFLSFYFLKYHLTETARQSLAQAEPVTLKNESDKESSLDLQNHQKNEEDNSEISQESEIDLKGKPLLARKFCNKCGTKLVEGAAFCNMCGAKQLGAGVKQKSADISRINKSIINKNEIKGHAVLILLVGFMIGSFLYFVLGLGGLRGKYYYYSSDGKKDDYTYIVFMSKGQARYVEDEYPYSATYKKEGNKVYITIPWAGETWEYTYSFGRLYTDNEYSGELRKW